MKKEFLWGGALSNVQAEGGYLEPDKESGYGYLEAIHNALEKTGELPE